MKKSWKILATLSFGLTLFVNFLAATSGINGRLTGAISDRYPTLFTPAGYVFSIWSLIYLGLLCFLLYAITQKEALSQKVLPYFVLTNLLNGVWMLCWHFDALLLSVMIMLGLLLSLLQINEEIYKNITTTLSQRVCMAFPFALYLGWISVATIANISVYLFSISWDGFGLSPTLWTIIMTAIATTLSLLRIVFRKDLTFLLVIIWALWGIRIKLLSYSGMSFSPSITDLRSVIFYEASFLSLVGLAFVSMLLIKSHGGK